MYYYNLPYEPILGKKHMIFSLNDKKALGKIEQTFPTSKTKTNLPVFLYFDNGYAVTQ